MSQAHAMRPTWLHGPISRPAVAGASHGGSKVPQLLLLFWIIKIAATTLGETGGDAASMSLHLGYSLSSLVFLGILAALVLCQIRARQYHPALYWAVIVATTTAGTTIADLCDRSLGIGYLGGSLLLSAGVVLVLAAWHRIIGSIAADRITSPGQEAFYWLAILASNTLGTALGDWAADSGGLGYEGGAVLFSMLLLVIVTLWARTAISRVLLFWAAFVMTRPLGATVGDLLTKPHAAGGLAIDRFSASGLLAAAIIGLVLLYPAQPSGDRG